MLSQLVLVLIGTTMTVNGFVLLPSAQQQQQQHHWNNHHTSSIQTPRPGQWGVQLAAKAGSKKKKTGASTGAVGGIKGFGVAAPGGKANNKNKSSNKKKAASAVTMDRSKDALEFYDFLVKNDAGDNLQRAALGYFPLPNGGSLRGVVAMKDIKKGDVLIRIPYELAINLGPEGGDPTLPGLELLRKYCTSLQATDRLDTGSTDGAVDHYPYFAMLPEFMGDDCKGSTDFFSDEALDALQSPLVADETKQRRQRVMKRFEQDIARTTSNRIISLDQDSQDDTASDDADTDSFPTWIDGTAVTEEHLRWAVWLITSRVLTVQGAADTNKAYRLLIPFLDMCNHDRSSPHVLTGRAVPGGELKVVAGANVSAGEQINIGYGGGVAGNDRFLQDYGFLDAEAAFHIVALQILGKRRVVEGAVAGKTMPVVDREATVAKLEETTVDQDRELLASTTAADMKAAIQYRIGVKESLQKYSD